MSEPYKIVEVAIHKNGCDANGIYLSNGAVKLFQHARFAVKKSSLDFSGRRERVEYENQGKIVNNISICELTFSTAKSCVSALCGSNMAGKRDLCVPSANNISLSEYLVREGIEGIPLDKVLFCNISWMKNYAGTIVDDKPSSGAEYVKNTGDAFEKYNFADFGDNYQYGFIETKYVHGVTTGQGEHYKKIAIEHFGASTNDEQADGILVIFFARNPKDNKYYIVGYYKNASVFRDRYDAPKINPNEQFQYNLKCLKENACLIKPEDRVPLNCPVQLFYRTLFIYPSDENENSIYFRKIVDAVLKYDSTKNCSDLSMIHNSWGIPCNPSYYDIDKALKELPAIWYKQNLKDVSAGDYVYLYLSAPFSAYKYKCLVLDSNVKLSDIDTNEDKQYYLKPETLVSTQTYMRIKLIKEGNVSIKDIIQNVENIGAAPQNQISLKKNYLDFLSEHFEAKISIMPSLADLDDEEKDTIDQPISSVPAEERTRENVTYIPRNEQTKKIALSKSNNKCGNDACNHELFRKKNGEVYLEVHHLIPIAAYKDFPGVNIDIPENAICLCPSCHREIHFGENSKGLIIQLYNERKELLESKGIILQNGIKQLLDYYGIE